MQRALSVDQGDDFGDVEVPGRKRHIMVNCLGLLLVVMVTTASVHNSNAAVDLLERLRGRFKKITPVWADGGHAGRLVTWANANGNL
ncbi:transposase [Streptomyces cynarae]|uniref:transposase n=1 Tax=Streptomyces cynarae TaxID=2981134 RepID=UPI00406C9480